VEGGGGVAVEVGFCYEGVVAQDDDALDVFVRVGGERAKEGLEGGAVDLLGCWLGVRPIDLGVHIEGGEGECEAEID